MTDKRVESEDIVKALSTLQDLAKGHSSGGTSTTKVESMVGESGASQVFHTPSNSDPGGWAGSSWRGEGWEDSIEANGTDLNGVKALGKSIAESIMAKLSKGMPLSARETNFVAKGGLNLALSKALPPDSPVGKAKDAKADKVKAAAGKADKDDEDEDKGHEDEEDDKFLVRNMVKKDSLKGDKADVEKSLMDHAAENPAVQQGFEVAEFLAGWATVMHKSLESMEERVVARILSSVNATAAEASNVSKSMAGALASLGEVLTAQQQRIDQVESAPARAPKSLQKSGVAPSPLDGVASVENMSKSQVTERLLDLVKKSEASAQDVLKFDSSGILSPELARKIAG